MGLAASGLRTWHWLVALSIFDACATDAGIRLHVIREGNPFAKALYETNVLLFYAYKILLPLLLLVLLRHTRERTPIIRTGVALVTTLYGLVALYHVAWMLYVAAE